MSGAPGVGQKRSPFDRTEISVLVSEYLDKLTIPVVYSELFNLLNTVSKLFSISHNILKNIKGSTIVISS